MRRATILFGIGLMGLTLQSGCHDDTPPPPRVPVPSAANREQVIEREYVKPLPPDYGRDPSTLPPAPARP